MIVWKWHVFLSFLFNLSSINTLLIYVILEFMARVQMDLIDMRSRPDRLPCGKTYRWILQLKDHFSKFCWAKALENKEAIAVFSVVREIFFQFGPPRILQSDNGREFVNSLIDSLKVDFPGIFSTIF